MQSKNSLLLLKNIDALMKSPQINEALRGSLARALRRKKEKLQPNWRAYSDFSRGSWSDSWTKSG